MNESSWFSPSQQPHKRTGRRGEADTDGETAERGVTDKRKKVGRSDEINGLIRFHPDDCVYWNLSSSREDEHNPSLAPETLAC